MKDTPDKPEFQTTSRISMKLDHFRFNSNNSRISQNNALSSLSNNKKSALPLVAGNGAELSVKNIQQPKQKQLHNKVLNLIETDQLENEESILVSQHLNQNSLRLSYLKRYIANGNCKNNLQFPDGYWNRIPGSKLKAVNSKSNNQILNTCNLNNSLNLKNQQQQQVQHVQQQPNRALAKKSITLDMNGTENSIAHLNNRELSIIDLQLPVLSSNNPVLANCLPTQPSPKRTLKNSHLVNKIDNSSESSDLIKNNISINLLLASKFFKPSSQAHGSNESDCPNEIINNPSETGTQDYYYGDNDANYNRNSNYNKYILEQQIKRQQSERNSTNNNTKLSTKQEYNCGSNINNFPTNALLIRRVKF